MFFDDVRFVRESRELGAYASGRGEFFVVVVATSSMAVAVASIVVVIGNGIVASTSEMRVVVTRRSLVSWTWYVL